MRRLRLLLVLVLAGHSSFALTGEDRIRQYRRSHEHQILREFVSLLSIPNVASDGENIRRNAALIMEMMKQRGLDSRLLEAETPNVPPAVYAEWRTPGATRTIILYAHYDGQPTDPKQWTGTLPWQPVLRSAALEAGGKLLPLPTENGPIDPEWRLYARSASDDKAGVMAILTAFDAVKANGIKPTSNIKFFFEGEEEAGSPHLGEIIRLHRELLESDAWIICDGPVHQSGRKQAVFGVRGDTNVDVTVYGVRRPLDSCDYGNCAPNPPMLLVRLLATMKDNSGRVTIAGWYDNLEPLGESERRAIAEAPQYDDELRAQLGLARSEGDGKRSEEHTSELQSLAYLVCRLLLEKKKKKRYYNISTQATAN